MFNIREIKDIFDNQLHIAVMVYQDKIIYANKKFQQLLGYTEEEILNLDPKELFSDNLKIKEKIKENIKKRLNGINFSYEYEPIEIKNKYHKRIIVKFLTQTIQLNDGSYAGLVFGIDLTNEYKKTLLINIFKNLNKIMLTANNEDEIFQKIVNTLYEKGKYAFVCVPFKDKSNTMIPKYYKGSYDENFLNYLKSIFKISPDYLDKCMATKAVIENKIIAYNDFSKVNFPNKELINNMLKYNFRSALFIPIYKNGEPYSFIGICSQFAEDFDKTTISFFEELKNTIEFSIKKTELNTFLHLLKEAVDKTFSWVLITDEKAKILYANKSVEKISGYKLNEILGKTPKLFKSTYHPKKFYKNIWEKIKNNKIFEGIIINKNKNDEIFFLKDKIIPVKAPNGKKYFISLGEDITTEQLLQSQLKKDLITNLPNRNEFLSIISNQLTNDYYAFIILDIRDFKIFNQTHGHEAGNKILQKISHILKSIFRKEDVIARIGPDEFGIWVKYHSIKDLYTIINKLINKIIYNKKLQNLSINLGIALYPQDSTNPLELIEKANVALEEAKNKGYNTYEFFSHEIDEKISEYSLAKNIITDALKNKNFVYYFQPYVDAKTFNVVGAETLLRIKTNDKLIYPNMFIDFAEKSGYIKDIEKLMFPKYLQYLKEVNIPLSFNISGKSLTDEEHIKSLFQNIEELPIVIELTEREIAENIEYTKKIFNFFKKKSFQISIDDFGTGYSSLTYLKDLPADYLKIDMSFIRNIENSPKDLAIVQTIIDFAHNFNLKTIAEGVENENQIKILQRLNCDYFQGFYFAKPMPFEEFKNFLSEAKTTISNSK